MRCHSSFLCAGDGWDELPQLGGFGEDLRVSCCTQEDVCHALFNHDRVPPLICAQAMAGMNSLSLAALEKTSTQYGSVQDNASEKSKMSSVYTAPENLLPQSLLFLNQANPLYGGPPHSENDLHGI
eukprot:1139726-Pelagomonas_calceolata.AAC.10